VRRPKFRRTATYLGDKIADIELRADRHGVRNGCGHIEGDRLMKALAGRFIDATSRKPIIGRMYDLLYHVHRHSGAIYRRAREAKARQEGDLQLVASLGLSDLVVKNGPFQGLRYPKQVAYGSEFLPKLIGSYEQELHGVIRGLSRDYTAVVDIGCAEGYYAVGLARMMPKARVHAFDIDENATRICREMAALNGVGARVHTGGLCTGQALRSLDLGDRALIVSDCEGYERILFDDAMAEHLRGHDLIVETHDFHDIEISGRIKSAFAETHDIVSIFSTDDIRKAMTYDYPQISGLALPQRHRVLQERRPAIMEWLVMTSKCRTVTQLNGALLEQVDTAPPLSR
jgi:hypothetical protein